MALNGLDFSAIVTYFVLLAAFGVIVRRVRSFSEYAVGGRTVPLAMIFASLSAAYIGPGYTMGFTAKGFSVGWLFWAVACGFTIQTLVVAWFIAPRLHRFTDCFTVGDIIGKTHGKFAHIVAGIFSTLLCIGFAAIMAKVGGYVIHYTLGWPTSVGVFVITGISVVYCFTGGLQSVIATEALQFAIFAMAIPALLWATAFSPGVDLAKANVDAIAAMRDAATQMGPLQVFGLFVSFLLGETLIPPYVNRALAAGSAEVARIGFLCGASYSVVWFGMVIGLGVIARQIVPDAPPDEVFMTLVTTRLPHGLMGLLIVAVIAIHVSAKESVLNAATVSAVRDIGDNIISIPNDRRRLLLSRIGTLIIGLIAAIAALYSPGIIAGLLIIYSIWAPGVLTVLLFSVLLRSPTPVAGAPAMLVGATTSLVWQFALKEPAGVPAILVGLAANIIVYVTIRLVTPPRQQTATEERSQSECLTTT